MGTFDYQPETTAEGNVGHLCFHGQSINKQLTKDSIDNSHTPDLTHSPFTDALLDTCRLSLTVGFNSLLKLNVMHMSDITCPSIAIIHVIFPYILLFETNIFKCFLLVPMLKKLAYYKHANLFQYIVSSIHIIICIGALS